MVKLATRDWGPKFDDLEKKLAARNADAESTRATLLGLKWSARQAGGDQYFPEPYPHLHLGGGAASLCFSQSASERRAVADAI